MPVSVITNGGYSAVQMRAGIYASASESSESESESESQSDWKHENDTYLL